MDPKLKYQTIPRRIVATIIDAIVFLPVFFIEEWIISKYQEESTLACWAIFYGYIWLFYTLFCHYKFGQTIGKWIMGLMVVDAGETRKLTLRQAFLRDIFYWVFETIGIVYFFVLLRQDYDPDFIFEDYKVVVDYPAFVWVAIELIFMLANKKSRAIHDYFARSVVVRVSAPYQTS